MVIAAEHRHPRASAMASTNATVRDAVLGFLIERDYSKTKRAFAKEAGTEVRLCPFAPPTVR